MRATSSSNSLQSMVVGLTRSSSTVLLSAKSMSGIPTIELDTNVFETFLVDTLSEYVSRSGAAMEVLENLQYQVKTLSKHTASQGNKLCGFQARKMCKHCSNHHLGEIALSLTTFVELTPTLPASVTAQVHSWIGLLSQQQGKQQAAIHSFLKALWIQSSLIPEEQGNASYDQAFCMALTRHRLGVAYGKTGKFAEACNILEKAIEEYQMSPVDTEKLRKHAQTELLKFLEANEIEATLGIPGAAAAVQRRADKGSRSGTEAAEAETPADPTQKFIPNRRSFPSLAAMATRTTSFGEPNSDASVLDGNSRKSNGGMRRSPNSTSMLSSMLSSAGRVDGNADRRRQQPRMLGSSPKEARRKQIQGGESG